MNLDAAPESATAETASPEPAGGYRRRECACGVAFVPRSGMQRRCDSCRLAVCPPTPTRESRPCAVCAKAFTPRQANGMFCGAACRARRHTPPPKLCACGQSFQPHGRQVRCNPRCLAGLASTPKAPKTFRSTKVRPPRACKRCRADFTPKTPTQRFCTERCSAAQAKAKAEEAKAARAAVAAAKPPPEPRDCEVCSQPFTPKPRRSNKPPARTCSSRCAMRLAARGREQAAPELPDRNPETITAGEPFHIVVERHRPKASYIGSPATLAVAHARLADLLRSRSSTDPWRQRLTVHAASKRGWVERPSAPLVAFELTGRVHRLGITCDDLAKRFGLRPEDVERALSGRCSDPAKHSKLRAALDRMERAVGLANTDDDDD